MGDDDEPHSLGEDDGLEAIGRRARPAVWIGAWAIGLSAVVALAILGSRSTEPSPGRLEARVMAASAGVVAASADVVAPQSSPTGMTSRVARPHPLPSRPPLGEDGLMGGIVFGTAWPPD